jgi:hypothetical protein
MYVFLDVYVRGQMKLSIKNGKMSQDDNDIKEWILAKSNKYAHVMYNCDITLVMVHVASKASNAKSLINTGKGYTGRIRKGQLIYLSAI